MLFMHACICVMVECVEEVEEDCMDIERVVVVVVYGAADDFNQRDNYN